MSVFGDFQRVWVQRFPDSALPAAWEEDVRANLVKHKQKVTALREELEKEEFYVEYLERLLADVERHKQLANSNATTTPEKQQLTEFQNQHTCQTLENSLPDSTNTSHTQHVEPSAPPLPVREDISKFQDKCVSELSSTLNTSKRPKSEIPRSPDKVPELRRNSDPDVPSNYVTVIEVTGSSKKDKNEESLKEEDEKDLENAINEDGEDGDAEASEEEPYYDSVALDQTGEYVYIDARVPPVGNNNGNRPPPRRPPSLPDSPGNQSNYVNIDYFIQHKAAMDSEDEEGASPAPPILLRALSTDNETGSSDAEPLSLSEGSLESPTPTTPRRQEKSKDREDDRTSMIKCIVNSVVESETIYVECLNVMLQYMKAIRATLTTSQPVISEDEFGTMFYKIPELHALHQTFLDGLRKKLEKWDTKTTIGEQFKMASNIGLYGAFLHNYARATDTVRRCSAHSTQFGEITRDIRLRGFPKGPGLSLEDLLHKPVARVQKNALVLHDLLKHTPVNHADHAPLSEALAMTRNFLDEFNIIQTKSMFPFFQSHDRAQRRLVKNSFVVELSDGHRKLRHLFLFNDVIACAKYKASGRDKFTFELKWYVPVAEAVVTEDGIEPRETSPANVVALRSQACTVRDQILWEERNDEKRIRLGGRGSEKNRKKLAELEAQLVLASPNLVLRVVHKSQHRVQNSYTFFLSSEFERSQWVEAVEALQQGGQPPGPLPLSMYELQAWVTACRTYLQTDMGSYLLRSGRDESLLLGDLHLTLLGLIPPGLDRVGDLYIIVEVDSYGHYFKRAKSRVARGQAPTWGETFVVELEGSQNVRILLYEECGTRSVLRGKCVQRLSRSWLQSDQVERSLNLGPATLDVALRFVPSEVTLRRVPSAKPQGLFGAKIQQVCKREKRDVPFIITACVREVERRGVGEVGLYRVSGSASDLTKLRKSFESNSYEAEQLLKEVDVHSVTGVLKLYLREMPEALFTDALYPAFLEAFQNSELSKSVALRRVYESLPIVNKAVIDFLLAHLIRVNKHETQNKMSLHNLATVFGPTLLRPGTNSRSDAKSRDPLAAGTVDVMAQAGILYCFLQMHMQQNNQSL
ncbi:active breakpoint cluster region-related protein isoform X4 [Colletes gigas]|uniref:active breakpoint cluster region-related protein isoform X4 n=1 Tax=Colletes gigas TaxID=935657 RepID=UPI001C9B9283|nr:active breakpoint cluster region-related protein isoform X4 [Colletes gigas]